MRSTRSYLYLCVLGTALSIAGCEEAREANLLDVRSVGPSELDPGHPLVIEGGPFAIHHAVDVRLVGELARAFAPPERISEDLAAHAVSEDRIEVAISEHLLRDRFGRATFLGSVEVREAAQWDGWPGAVLGRANDVTLELVPARSSRANDRALDRVLGVRWTSDGERGLAIEHVEPGGRAAEVGIRAGDVVTGEGHARFMRGDTPIVPTETTTLDLLIERSGEPTRSVAVLLGAVRETEAGRDLAMMVQFSIVLAWIALLLALPLRSIAYARPRVAPGLARPTAALVARLALSLALAHAIVRAMANGALPDTTLVIAIVVGARAALLFVDARGDVRVLPIVLLSSAGLAAGLAAIPIALGTASLASLTRDGAASPLTWALFTEPVGPLALGSIAASLAATRVKARAACALDDLVILAVAALVVVEGTGLLANTRAGSIALPIVIGATAWSLGLTRGKLRPAVALAAILALGVSGVVSLSAWALFDPPPLVRATAAETLLAICVTAALAGLRHATATRVAARSATALL